MNRTNAVLFGAVMDTMVKSGGLYGNKDSVSTDSRRNVTDTRIWKLIKHESTTFSL